MESRHVLTATALVGLLAILPVPAPADDVDLDYYLPPGGTYDPDVPKPSSVLGFEVGEWHVRHDQLTAYLHRLAASSDRVRIEETGRTHERRQLLLLTISSPENLARLDEIREAHLQLSDPAAPAPDTSEMPVVVNLGYSVHGNEASGSNASLLAAWYLAAAQGQWADRVLASCVVLLDPSLNPDGLARFAQWANMHRGQVLVGDPDHREHREGWPNGRTNHYWFDLNRDWLLGQHPETRARLEQFHRWRPNVLIDVHEMGSQMTYFFQPGVPSRKNPLTPAKNVALTEAFARYHAEALDELGRGSLYYSEETFDDFYYGKGSTYPDLHGAVGILFEQASVRGHLQETPNGDLSFPFAIRNQLHTTLSTLQAALDRRVELLDYQREFYVSARQEAAGDDLAGWVFGEPRDPARAHHFLELLLRHRVEVRAVRQAIEAGGRRFEPGEAWVVPTDQSQVLLARTLFERRLDFADSTFYDVSTWTAPLAFDLPFAEVRGKLRPDRVGEPLERSELPSYAPPEAEAYAYAFEWDGYYAPRSLARLLAAEVKARVATRPFQARSRGGETSFGLGTIVVPTGIQTVEASRVAELLAEAASRDATRVHAIDSGLTPEGIDLGSPSLKALSAPAIGLVVGSGVDTYAAGEVWHLLDHRQEMAVSLLDVDRLGDLDLGKYSHLILVDGSYDGLDEKAGEDLWRWVKGGGALIATQKAISWVDEHVREAGEDDSDDEGPPEPPAAAPPVAAGEVPGADAGPERRPYGQHESDRAAQLISGAIFEVDLDVTHPLAYGYRRPTLPVFRNHKVFLEPETDPYVSVAVYRQDPLLSGYVSSENLGKLPGTPALTAHRAGRGILVRMADDPSFRAFWYGTDKLLLNAIFFGPVVEDTAKRNGGHEE